MSDDSAPEAEAGSSPAPRVGWEDIYAKSLDCVHCGLCLSACPTYLETGRETSSPRGRIYLMRGVAEGRLPLGETLAEEAHLCLGCRACETACPSGVRYGAMVERVRHEVHEAGLRRGLAPWIERLLLRRLVAHPGRLHAAMGLLAVVQRLGLDRGLAPLLPRRLRDAQALLPRVPAAAARAPMPEHVPAVGEVRGHVALFVGCVMPELFGDVNRETARVLAANGFEVSLPPAQGCCGALHAHAGDERFGRQLARRNLAAFAAPELEAVILNSAGCGAALRDAGDWLPGEGAALASRVRDVCEWLAAKGWTAPLGRIDARVCYDDPCHLLHGQGVGAAPRRLLRAIPGVEWLEHDHPGACCGAAGTYNVTQPEMARAVLARKLESLAAADPDLIVTGNPGCLMQLRAGVANAGLRGEVIHPVTLLDRAIRAAAHS
jgi:glycolate oxidase iron-sulfur subunit